VPTTSLYRLICLGLLLAVLAFGGCASTSAAKKSTRSAADQQYDQLVSWMTGSFSSAAQAERDDQYFDIRLQMVRIWPDLGSDQAWLYVEQATASALDRPYRQRVYRVRPIADGSYESAVYELPADPQAFAGWWKTPELFDRLNPEDLTELSGCTVTVRFDEQSGSFRGGTEQGTCASSLRGAAYVMSEATITPDMLLTWDRGYDSAGRQVWGATDGGYEFVRVR
jgi:CpeT protein